MKDETKIHLVAVMLVVALAMGLGGCCCENGNSNCGDLKLHPIFEQAVIGAIVGGIVGYQSREEGEGAAIGAGLFVVGELLRQGDQQCKAKERARRAASCEVTVDIHNSNGSITPVKLKKEGNRYVGPKGERYEKLPTEEQLKPLYGLNQSQK